MNRNLSNCSSGIESKLSGIMAAIALRLRTLEARFPPMAQRMFSINARLLPL